MKNIVVLLIVLALVGGFVLFMRQQDIKKEMLAEKARAELAAKKLEQEKELKAQEERRQREKEIERERRERERREEMQARDAKRQREECEAAVLAKKRQIAALRQQLNELRGGNTYSPEEKRIADEIDRIDRILNDRTYQCFDFCITFRNVDFFKSMHGRRQSDDRGYYYTESFGRNSRGKKRKVQVAYHCDVHNLDWTKKKADSYRQNYTPKTELESQKHRLKAALARAAGAGRSKNAAEAARIEADIAAAEKELAELKKAPIGQSSDRIPADSAAY